jgi:hypothetical protein
MRLATKFLAASLACSATVAHAATPTTDYSDLWFNANEEGWGANVIQQNNILFVTLFLNNQATAPVWYVASSVQLTSSTATTATFTGPLYQTTAPYFGGAFNEANVTNRQVGTLTFNATGISAATLSYSVDGVNVTKSVTRQTWRAENIAGTYAGGVTGTWSGCGGPRNGYQESFVTLTVSQDNLAINMREDGAGGTGGTYTCTYQGNYTQDGRMGSIAGNVLCSDGVNQAFTATEVQGGLQGLSMRLVATPFSTGGTCTFTGRMGGMRRAP